MKTKTKKHLTIYTAAELRLVNEARALLTELASYDAATRALKPSNKLARLPGRREITSRIARLPEWAVGEAKRCELAQRCVDNHWSAPEMAARLLKWAEKRP